MKVREFALLSKALRPLPDKWHGLADVDTRFRQRYVDLIANDDARRIFAIRFAVVAAIREFLAERAASSRWRHRCCTCRPAVPPRGPFFTHHNALDMPLTLRIALELHLKRLARRRHRARLRDRPRVPQRGTVHSAQPRVHDARVLPGVRRLHRHDDAHRGARRRVRARRDRTHRGHRRRRHHRPRAAVAAAHDARAHRGARRRDVHPSMPVEELERICDDVGVPHEPGWGPGKLVLELYEKTVEPNLAGPVFVCDYPREVSPLARDAPRRSRAGRAVRSRRARARAGERVQRAQRPGRPAGAVRGPGEARGGRRRRGARRRRGLRAGARVRPPAVRWPRHRHRPARSCSSPRCRRSAR